MTSPEPRAPVRFFKDDAAWEAWLPRQHARSAGLWLRIAKAASNVKSVSYAEALDVALCYGWIARPPAALWRRASPGCHREQPM